MRIHQILNNEEKLYKGTLSYYFKIMVLHATNLNNPYHNMRHMLHVMWMCYQACVYYKDQLTKEEMRILLIAAIFHDFDHLGRGGLDGVNIQLALLALHKHCAPEDRKNVSKIGALLRVTEYPHRFDESTLTLSECILLDADMSQAFSDAWIQQIVVGLGTELSRSVPEMLAGQKAFLDNIQPYTSWGREWMMEKKKRVIDEAEALLAMLV